MTSRHLKWSGEDWENRAGREQRQVQHHQVSIFQESFLMVHTKFEFEQQAREGLLCTQHQFDFLLEPFVSACWSSVNFSALFACFFAADNTQFCVLKLDDSPFLSPVYKQTGGNSSLTQKSDCNHQFKRPWQRQCKDQNDVVMFSQSKKTATKRSTKHSKESTVEFFSFQLYPWSLIRE